MQGGWQTCRAQYTCGISLQTAPGMHQACMPCSLCMNLLQPMEGHQHTKGGTQTATSRQAL